MELLQMYQLYFQNIKFENSFCFFSSEKRNEIEGAPGQMGSGYSVHWLAVSGVPLVICS